MSDERLYAALMLGSVIEPAKQMTTWLVTPGGPPPVDLLLMASALATAANQLTEFARITQDGAP